MEETTKINASQAVACLGVLQKLMGYPFEDVTHSFAIARAYAAMSKNSEVMAVELTRQKLIERHGRKNDAGLQVPPEAMYDFVTDYMKVSVHEIQIPALKLPMAALVGPAKERLLTPQDVSSIEPFLSE